MSRSRKNNGMEVFILLRMYNIVVIHNLMLSWYYNYSYVTKFFFIRKVPNSNPGPKTSSNKAFRGVPPSLEANSGTRK